MARRKSKNRNVKRNLAYIFFISLIIIGLGSACETQKNAADEEYPASAISEAEKLMAVEIPDDLKSIYKRYEGFDLSFNPDHKVPNYVAWELTRAEARAQEASRKDGAFNPDVTVDSSPTLDDYRNSGFDRGHMCPAGDMKWDVQAMRDCFLLTNMCPQAHSLNSGAWKSLEETCRDWAVRDSAIIIICGPVLTDKITRTIGQGKVTVPERFFKVVLAPYANPPRAIGFVMPNSAVRGGYQNTATTVDDIEAITGYDFFAALPDDLENKIEATADTRTWFKR